MMQSLSLLTRRELLSAAAALSVAGCRQAPGDGKLEVVRMAGLAYGDHTQASIGLARNLFKQEGIDLRYDTIRIEQAVALLSSGRYDVVSLGPGVLLQGFNEAPDLKLFVYATLFQGYALMAPHDSPAKTFEEVAAHEPDLAKAARETIAQMRGKRFVYPSEGGIKPFIDLLLETGGLSRGDYRPMVMDDALGVATMKRGDADFQVGGAPSRISLQKAGFKPIISAVDIAKAASPSPDSKALRAVFPDGWAARSDYIETKHDVIVRMARVAYRINALINSDPTVAQQHMSYLSKVTGQSFTTEDARIIYSQLDPFFTLEQQKRWFTDKSYPLFHEYVIGANIKSFEEDKLFAGRRVPTVADITIADRLYNEIVSTGGLATHYTET